MRGPSKAASAQLGVPCRVCGADPLQPCRTAKTNRVTDTHMPRLDDCSVWRRVLTTHHIVADWTCLCGMDLFGGSAAYSALLLREHRFDEAKRMTVTTVQHGEPA